MAVLRVRTYAQLFILFGDHYHRVDSRSWFGDWRQNILLIEGLLQTLMESYWYSPWGMLNRVNVSIQTYVVLSFKAAHPVTENYGILADELVLGQRPA